MKLKSFFADTVEQAISIARREMGPDAMLLNSKRSSPEAQHLGSYEVVCALAGEPAQEQAGSEPAPPRPRPGDRLGQDITELKQQVERLARSLARCGSGMAGIQSDPEIASAFTTLTDAELDTDLAYELISKMSSPASPGTLRMQLGELVSVDSELGCPGASHRIAALIGPPGCGKTMSVVKLAVQYGIALRRSVQLLTLDTYRVAAADQLQAYAAILGIGCQVVDTPAALTHALDEHCHKDLVLIDTPGLSSNELEVFEDLTRLLAAVPDLDTHLVLPASMRTSDLKRVADQYATLKPRKLLFTRLDETQTFGPILSQSIRMCLPISFLSQGQRIPEDLDAATPDLLLSLILKSQAPAQRTFGVAAA
jgi:flagellar biosynthesis protein FlhF